MKSTSKGGLKGRETIQGEPDREALGRAAPGGRENAIEKKPSSAPTGAGDKVAPPPEKREGAQTPKGGRPRGDKRTAAGGGTTSPTGKWGMQSRPRGQGLVPCPPSFGRPVLGRCGGGPSACRGTVAARHPRARVDRQWGGFVPPTVMPMGGLQSGRALIAATREAGAQFSFLLAAGRFRGRRGAERPCATPGYLGSTPPVS